MIFIGVYVDDILLAARNEKQLIKLKKNLQLSSTSRYFLGVKVE